MAGHLRITPGVLPEGTRVLAFRGREAMSSLYELEVFMLVPHDEDVEVDLEDAVGSKATLYVDEAAKDAKPSRFSGIWASLELVNDAERHSMVRGILVPRLWELGLSHHSRVFTNLSPLEVIRSVLADAGLSGGDVEIRAANGPAEEHITQYRESDLAFVSRWMEREGLYYFFEHGDHGEKLVIASGSSYPDDELGVPVGYRSEGGTRHDGLRQFVARHALVAGQVRVRDYDYARPQLEMAGHSHVGGEGGAEVNLAGERFFSPEEGARLARIRAEELRCRRVVYQGSGNRRHLRAGHAFTLEHHPRGSLNHVKYLVIEAQHRGSQDIGEEDWIAQTYDIDTSASYAVDIVAIPASAQFRPERRTPWPRIYGYESGHVEGPGVSDYAQLDDQGRYRVKLRFDEGTQRGSRASTYVRMMQPHGGSVEGFHFPLRKDTEVVVSFLGGDPDRPVISGVVPNALTPSPVTSGNHTKNVIQTGGHNRLELEDQAGEERVTMQTPYSNTFLMMGAPSGGHECTLKTDDNTLIESGQDMDVVVGKDLDVLVGVNHQTTVTAGYYHVTVNTGPISIHALANRVDIHANTSFHIEAENDQGLIEAKTYLSLRAHDSFGRFKSKTKMTLESETADLEAKAGQAFLVEAKGATGTARSKGMLTLHSTEADAELHAATGIRILTDANGIDITAPDTINIHSTGAMVKVTSGGEAKFDFLGAFSMTSKSASSTYTHGAKMDVRFGVDSLFSLAAKTEVSAGMSLALKASLALEISAAMSIKATVFKAELETLKQTMCVLNNANHGVNMRGAAAWLGSHGFKGNVGGIELHA